MLNCNKLNGGPDTSGYFVQNGPLPFGSDYVRTQGGTTLHWPGTRLRMLPNDFRLHSEYGQAKDWPISYDDLRPYYEIAEKRSASPAIPPASSGHGAELLVERLIVT